MNSEKINLPHFIWALKKINCVIFTLLVSKAQKDNTAALTHFQKYEYHLGILTSTILEHEQVVLSQKILI